MDDTIDRHNILDYIIQQALSDKRRIIKTRPGIVKSKRSYKLMKILINTTYFYRLDASDRRVIIIDLFTDNSVTIMYNKNTIRIPDPLFNENDYIKLVNEIRRIADG